MSKLVLLALFAIAAAALADSRPGAGRPSNRYVVERTFPPGALDGLDAALKRSVNDNNATHEVRWVRSYASADRTKTFCIYEGPSERAVRDAAALNGLPVDHVVEVPVDLTPGPTEEPKPGAASRRFLVERAFGPGALDGLDADAKRKVNETNARLGVRWIHSFASADLTKTFCVYEGPNADAVRTAASRNGIPADRVVEVPVDLTPR